MLPTGALNLAIINPSGLLLSHLSGPLCCQSSHITDLYYSTFTSPMFWRDDDPISNSTLKTHLPEIPSSVCYPLHLEHIYTLNSTPSIYLKMSQSWSQSLACPVIYPSSSRNYASYPQSLWFLLVLHTQVSHCELKDLKILHLPFLFVPLSNQPTFLLSIRITNPPLLIPLESVLPFAK